MLCAITLAVCIFTITAQGAPVVDQYEEDMAHRKAMALDCINQVHIDRKVIEEAISDPIKLPTDPKYKDFLACSYKKQKFQNTDGKMSYNEIYKFLSRFYEMQDLNVLENCKSVSGANDGEIAYNTLKCIMSYLSEIKSRDEKIETNSV